MIVGGSLRRLPATPWLEKHIGFGDTYVGLRGVYQVDPPYDVIPGIVAPGKEGLRLSRLKIDSDR